MSTTEQSLRASQDTEPVRHSTTMASNKHTATANKEPTTSHHQESVTETQADTNRQTPRNPDPATPSNRDSQKGTYVKLKPSYAQDLTWSNDPGDLDLYGAFRKGKPNLASDFRVKGLRPILKEKDGDWYLLMDAKDYYLWDPWDGHLLRVSDEIVNEDNDDPYEGLEGVEKAVHNIISGLYWALKDAQAVFRTN